MQSENLVHGSEQVEITQWRVPWDTHAALHAESPLQILRPFDISGHQSDIWKAYPAQNERTKRILCAPCHLPHKHTRISENQKGCAIVLTKHYYPVHVKHFTPG